MKSNQPRVYAFSCHSCSSKFTGNSSKSLEVRPLPNYKLRYQLSPQAYFFGHVYWKFPAFSEVRLAVSFSRSQIKVPIIPPGDFSGLFTGNSWHFLLSDWLSSPPNYKLRPQLNLLASSPTIPGNLWTQITN